MLCYGSSAATQPPAQSGDRMHRLPRVSTISTHSRRKTVNSRMKMLLSRLFSTSQIDQKPAAAALYRAVVAQARAPAFYVAYGVPDTLDGRFDLIALHMFLVLHRLKSDTDASTVSQALFDIMFDDMDRSLREMGVGDLGVGRRVRAMAEALYGRMAAYEA